MSTFGPAFDRDLDFARITYQMGRILDVMLTQQWYSLAEIATRTGDPEASVSAQLRHLRKPRFGGYVVEKRRRTAQGGTWEYRLTMREVLL